MDFKVVKNHKKIYNRNLNDRAPLNKVILSIVICM